MLNKLIAFLLRRPVTRHVTVCLLSNNAYCWDTRQHTLHYPTLFDALADVELKTTNQYGCCRIRATVTDVYGVVLSEHEYTP